MELLKELNLNILAGLLLVMLPDMARIYHLDVLNSEENSGQEAIALLATISESTDIS